MLLRFVRRVHFCARHVKTGNIKQIDIDKIGYKIPGKRRVALMRAWAIMRNGHVCEEQINTLIRFVFVLLKLKSYTSQRICWCFNMVYISND